LTALQSLALGGNQLSALPPEIGALTALQSLDLHGNQLSALPPEIGALTALQSLWLMVNRLSSLPPEIGALTALQSLELHGNQLSALPPEIGALTALQELELRSNRLSSLPPEIGALTALRFLYLAGNPLVTPPPEVVEQGLEAIRSYLRELGRTGEPLFEAKIVLVGEGAVGKTTLKERLIRDRFATPGSTRGLEMEAVPRAHPTLPGKTMTLNFWDFGGQEDYRPAQQFFFSTGALYILVWHAREDATRSNIEVWMRLIRHRVGPSARVLVVATHADAHPPGDSVRQLCADKFPGTAVGFLSVDNKSGKGAPELWQAIEREVVQLEEFGAERPKSWIDARDAILRKREGAPANQMPFADFRKLAIDKGVAEDAVETFAAMLTSQGRIVYHGDDRELATTVVLDPEWLMKAIAYVLTDTETKDSNGILPETSLARIWLNHARAQAENPIRYEKEHWNHLLRMMDRHDIVYRLREHEWLVGQLVSLTKPCDLPWDGRSHLGNGAPLVTECRLDDQIPGLMALLTVRTHFYHYNFRRFCWRDGVFLRDPNHTDTLALIEADGPQKLRISTVGTFSQSLMERLAGSLEQLIHEMWPGGAAAEAKPYAFIVPCPTEGCPGYYLRDDLFRDLADGDDTSRCNEGRRCRHDIRKLLTGQPAPQAFEEIIRRFDRVDGQLAGISGKLDDVRGQIGNMLSLVSFEAPRIYSLRVVEAKLWDAGMKKRIEIQIWCEELNRPVPKAVEVVALDKDWVKHLREGSPRLKKLLKLATSVAGGSLASDLLGDDYSEDLKELCEGTDEVLDAAEIIMGEKGAAPDKDPDGRVELKGGQYLAPDVVAVLRKAAKNGGMTRIQMDDDKRWRWVCREVAARNDRSVPKE
jgi:GTPase SAR1 family protein